MDRRRLLLIIAAVVAAFGTLLVFLYVRSADARAQESVDAVDVLTVSQPIASGESYDDALTAGKIVPQGVARSQLLANVQTNPDALKGTVALQSMFPGEQVVSDKFGANAAEAASPLGIPEGKMAISVNLTDPDRVAGFVNPGSEVAIFVTDRRSRRRPRMHRRRGRRRPHSPAARPGHGPGRRQHHAGHDDHHHRRRDHRDRAASQDAADPRAVPGGGAEGDPGVQDTRRHVRPADQGQHGRRGSDHHQH